MKWKKGLMMVLVLLVVGVKVNYSYGEPYSDEIPRSSDIKILYEGYNTPNEKDYTTIKESYDYYRITVKYNGGVNNKREVPESLIIYETSKESGKKKVHEVYFGESAGKSLADSKEDYFLDKENSFYYRSFTVKGNPKGEYEYSCTLTWPKNPGRTESSKDTISKQAEKTLTVNVNKLIETQVFKYGVQDMFGAKKDVKDKYTLDSEYLPVDYGGSQQDDKYPMNRIWPGKDNVTLSGINGGMFIGNASLQTHVMYVGKDPLPEGTKVKFILRSDTQHDNSKNLPFEKEVPAISKALTELVTDKAPENMHPKKYIDVYMGMGTGPQGSLSANDKDANDVSYLFGTKDGVVHTGFAIRIEDQNGKPIPNLIFDFINVKYNPYIFGQFDKVSGDGFIKPSGYMMLKSKFHVEHNIMNPQLKLSMDQLLGANELTSIVNIEEEKMQLFIGGSLIPATLNDNKMILIDTDKLPSNLIVNIPDPDKEGSTIKVLKPGDYDIKMYIPTSLREGYNINDYNNLVKLANKENELRKVYPIKFEINQYEEALKDKEEKLVKYVMEYDITPYRMPGIN